MTSILPRARTPSGRWSSLGCGRSASAFQARRQMFSERQTWIRALAETSQTPSALPFFHFWERIPLNLNHLPKMGVFVLSPCGFSSNLPLVSFEGDGSFSPIFKSSALLNQEQRQGWERVHHHQHFVTKLARHGAHHRVLFKGKSSSRTRVWFRVDGRVTAVCNRL